MIASLMMYARPELDGAHDRYWALIVQELASRGIEAPANLSNAAGEFEVWEAPDLVLSQTCGMPFRTRLHDKVTLIGTPDFGVPGCPPGYYASPIIVRNDDARTTLTAFKDALFTYNMNFSQSGFAAIYATTQPLGFWFENRRQSGGHLASARAIAEGDADIAALDAVSWRLISRYEPFATRLRVLEWTKPTPGLPYISCLGANQPAIFEAVQQAIARLEPNDQIALGIKGLIEIPKANYLAIPNPPPEAG